MAQTQPGDLTADELYRLLKDNPDQQTFTPDDLDAAKEGDR